MQRKIQPQPGAITTACVYVLPWPKKMGLVRIMSWYPKSNVSHFGLPPSSNHRMTGLGGKIVWTMTYSHKPRWDNRTPVGTSTCSLEHARACSSACVAVSIYLAREVCVCVRVLACVEVGQSETGQDGLKDKVVCSLSLSLVQLLKVCVHLLDHS